MNNPIHISSIEIPAADAAALAQPYSFEERVGAIKLGMLEALSSAGIEPEVFEAAVKYAAVQHFKAANGLVEAPAKILELVKTYGPAAIIGAGIAGGYSGLARHSMEKSLAGEGDPEAAKLERQVKTYEQMRKELLANLAARGHVPAAVAV